MSDERVKKKYTHQFVLASLLISASLLFYTMRFFIDAFLGALTLYILFRPMMRKMVFEKGWKPGNAAMLILLISFVAVLIPVVLISFMIVPKISILFSEQSFTLQLIQQIDGRINNVTGIELLSDENLNSLRSAAAEFIGGFLGMTVEMIGDITILYFILFYFLINTGGVERFVEKYVPLSKSRTDEFGEELRSQTVSNVLGSPLLALVQGLFASLGYWIFGLQEPLFWGLMTGFFSFLPVVGSTLIWLPAAVYQFSVSNTWQGAGILLYGILVISVVDNVFRFVFQKKFADVHPLITVIGVIAGLQLFGVAGIIFGPLLISYFLLLLRIFREEFLAA